MSGVMSEARLAEIEARERAATPGPWRRWVGKLTQSVSVMQGTGRDEVVHWTGFDNSHLSGNRRANGAFIAHARQDVPELTAEVRRLRNELAAMKDRGCESCPTDQRCGTCGRWDGSLAHLPHLKDKGECVHFNDDDGESVYIYGLPRFMPADKPGCYDWLPREVAL